MGTEGTRRRLPIGIYFGRRRVLFARLPYTTAAGDDTADGALAQGDAAPFAADERPVVRAFVVFGARERNITDWRAV